MWFVSITSSGTYVPHPESQRFLVHVPASPRPRVPASPRPRVPASPRPRVPAPHVPLLGVPASHVPASPSLTSPRPRFLASLVPVPLLVTACKNTPGKAVGWQKGRLQQRGRGTDAETALSECSDEVYLVLLGCEWVSFSIKSGESFLAVNGCWEGVVIKAFDWNIKVRNLLVVFKFNGKLNVVMLVMPAV